MMMIRQSQFNLSPVIYLPESRQGIKPNKWYGQLKTSEIKVPKSFTKKSNVSGFALQQWMPFITRDA